MHMCVCVFPPMQPVCMTPQYCTIYSLNGRFATARAIYIYLSIIYVYYKNYIDNCICEHTANVKRKAWSLFETGEVCCIFIMSVQEKGRYKMKWTYWMRVVKEEWWWKMRVVYDKGGEWWGWWRIMQDGKEWYGCYCQTGTVHTRCCD